MPGARVAVHESLRVEVVAGGAALHQVRGDRERRPREADDRHPVPERRADPPDRLEHERHRLRRITLDEPLDVGTRPHRPLDHRPVTRRELEPDAHRLDDQQDVGEEDRGVHAEPLDREDRHLRRGLRVLAQVEEPQARPHGAVLGQIAAGLPHQPDRRVVGRRTATCGEKRVHGPPWGLDRRPAGGKPHDSILGNRRGLDGPPSRPPPRKEVAPAKPALGAEHLGVWWETSAVRRTRARTRTGS